MRFRLVEEVHVEYLFLCVWLPHVQALFVVGYVCSVLFSYISLSGTY